MRDEEILSGDLQIHREPLHKGLLHIAKKKKAYFVSAASSLSLSQGQAAILRMVSLWQPFTALCFDKILQQDFIPLIILHDLCY